MKYLSFFVYCIMSLGIGSLQAEIKYNVVEVPSIDNRTTFATHINENGLLVGQCGKENEYEEKEGLTIGFVWDLKTGEQTILQDKDHDVEITGLNDRNEVIGLVVKDAYWSLGDGFIWTAKKGTQFLKKEKYQYACPVSINNLGQIVGLRSSLKLGHNITLWEGKNVESLDKKITNGLDHSWMPTPVAINDKGQILFWYKFDKMDWLDGQIDNAFIWEHSKHRYLSLLEDFEDIGENDHVFLELAGFNNQGDIVGKREKFRSGYGWVDSIFESSIWNLDADKKETPISKQFANERAKIHGINDLRQIVGCCRENDSEYAVTWDEANDLQNLNDLIDPSLGWLLIDALSINNQGQIVGIGKKNGKTAGFLLLPID